MKNRRLCFFAFAVTLLVSACSTSMSGGYSYNNTSGSNASQQQTSTQNGGNSSGFSQSNQSQTNVNNSWSSKRSFSVGGGNQ